MYVKVTVHPDSKKEELIQKSEISFEVKVKEKAERNMANNRIRQILADFYGVTVGKVRIINGHHSPRKMLSIDTEKGSAQD